MGACSFSTVGYGKTAREAYEELVAEAQYEYGHDPYNGTISTTNGFVMKPLGQKKFTKQAIDRWVDNTFDIGKGDCHCLELPRSYAKGKGRGVRAFLFAGVARM